MHKLNRLALDCRHDEPARLRAKAVELTQRAVIPRSHARFRGDEESAFSVARGSGTT